MATQREELVAVHGPVAQPSSASLVGGLITDVQSLVRQEIALVRQETLEDLGRLKRAGMSAAPAAALLALGSLLLGLALAQGTAALLQWPDWAGYLGIGAILAFTGFLLISVRMPVGTTGKERSNGRTHRQ